MDWPTIRIDDAARFLAHLDELSEGDDWLWRGQARPWTSIRSSLDLLLDPDLPYAQRLALERRAVEHFRAEASHFVSPHELALCDSQSVAALTVMRHYGVPTRLVDWTRSPYVAAYFAAIHEPNEDGVVWGFHEEAFLAAAHAAWGAHGISPPKDTGPEFDRLAFHEHSAEWIAPVNLPVPFDRPQAQRGLFTMAGRLGLAHDRLIGALIPDSVRRLDIPSVIKPALIERLRRRGVHAWALRYAGADELGFRIRAELQAASPPPARSQKHPA